MTEEGDEPISDEVARLHDQFDHALDKWSNMHMTKLRALEDAVRGESIAMLNRLRDEVCASMNSKAEAPVTEASRWLLDALTDELFSRPEVMHGLVDWLSGSDDRLQAKQRIDELHADILAGNGNDLRTSITNLLPVYMKELGVRDILGSGAPSGFPNGRPNDKQGKFLGDLVTNWMVPFLQVLQKANSTNATHGEPFAPGDALNFNTTINRLRTALFSILNTGNFASHHRGELTYCQRLELCAAVGAMAETLPKIAEVCKTLKPQTDPASKTSPQGTKKTESKRATKVEQREPAPVATIHANSPSQCASETSPDTSAKKDGKKRVDLPVKRSSSPNAKALQARPDDATEAYQLLRVLCQVPP